MERYRTHSKFPGAKQGLLLCALLCLFGNSPILATEIFKWVDENGITHFGDRPPQTAEASLVPLEDEPQSAGVGMGLAPPTALEVNEEGKTRAQQMREALISSRIETGQEQEQLEAACAHHQEELARFEPARRITYTDENGEMVRLDDDQRMMLIERTREFLDKYCL